MIAEEGLTALRSYRLIMATIFAGAIAVGWLILPGQNERVAMLERDGHSREALSILEQLFGSGDRRYNTLYQMQQLYEDEGNVPKARQFLEEMVAARPRDAALKRKLAQFYRNTHDNAAYVSALKAQIDLRYSELACRELAAFLRLKGDYAEEQAALQTCRQKGYRRPDDMSRLADLIAAGGDTVQAAALLRSIDDLRRLNSPRERYQLLTLLLDQDQPKEAERRCLRWIRASKDDELALGLIEILAGSKYPASAIDVAKDAGTPGDSISLTVAERLVEQSQTTAARLYLRGWLDKSQATAAETAVRFLDAAVAAGDAATAFAGAKKFGFAVFPIAKLDALAKMLDNAGLADNASEVRAAAGEASAPFDAPSLADQTKTQNENGAEPPSAAPHNPTVSIEPIPKPGSRQAQREQTPSKDPLDGWRKSLATKMADDAARRLQASTQGPPVPAHLNGHHFERRIHRHFGRFEAQDGSIKLFKKTSKVLIRAKKNRLLRSKRPQIKDQAKDLGKRQGKDPAKKETLPAAP